MCAATVAGAVSAAAAVALPTPLPHIPIKADHRAADLVRGERSMAWNPERPSVSRREGSVTFDALGD